MSITCAVLWQATTHTLAFCIWKLLRIKFESTGMFSVIVDRQSYLMQNTLSTIMAHLSKLDMVHYRNLDGLGMDTLQR